MTCPWRPTCWPASLPVAAPDTAWVTDITYLWTQEGWLYLAVILDLFSRAVVGWALSTQITRELTLQALTMALGRRRPRRACSITRIAAASTRAATIGVRCAPTGWSAA